MTKSALGYMAFFLSDLFSKGLARIITSQFSTFLSIVCIVSFFRVMEQRYDTLLAFFNFIPQQSSSRDSP